MKMVGRVVVALSVPVLVVTLALNGAEPQRRARPRGATTTPEETPGPMKAVAVLHPISKSKVSGKVIITQENGVVIITGEITGLPPGEHAFHVHEFGDCSSDDGMSTGPHFNPDNKPHGGPHDVERHVGDLGNIKADEDGKVTLNIKDSMIKLSGPHSVIGRAFIVHGGVDDLKSQPAGNAGSRIACGVIGVAKP
jgi:Cu-Zn family superoxide dismutase